MKKSTVLRTLNYLKNRLEDQDLIDNVLELEKAVESFEDEKSSTTNTDFLVPNEIANHNFAFALFSDGACRGNPGPGAWGMVAQDNKSEIIFHASGVDTSTTNNRMELMGAMKALKSMVVHLEELKANEKPLVHLYSDSKYVVDGISKWVPGWKSRNWKKADKKEPENVELWKELDKLNSLFSNLKFLWVKGHSGHPQNEFCDRLANEALDESGY